MEPRAIHIQDIAIYDPIVAYGIVLGIPRVPISLNACGIFSSFAVPQLPVEGDLDTTIAQRTWIDNITYSLDQPNVFSGNIFKTLYDAQLKQHPGISTRVTVQSGPRYLVSPQYTPIENFVNMFASRYPAGWPLYKLQSIQVDFLLTTPPPSVSPNGPPYNVTMTFNGWQFLDHTLDELCREDAAACLKKMGFWVPDVACVRGPVDCR
jgi:hypothetical protein